MAGERVGSVGFSREGAKGGRASGGLGVIPEHESARKCSDAGRLFRNGVTGSVLRNRVGPAYLQVCVSGDAV